ncbi:MAG: DUF3179 domain-containing protein [Calditrichaeota bacterium]|nr:MAG: DUF3179 domain-containing protein [Calditrichota bacterium]
MKSFYCSFIAFLVVAMLGGCDSKILKTTQPGGKKPFVDQEDNNGGDNPSGQKIYIVDQTGKRWDVTHAVEKYGFKAEAFQYGLGPDAIPPLLHPEMLSPGEPGYPGAHDSFLVLGARIEEEARAYPIDVMSRHEIVDEVFDATYVAVAY